MKKLIILNVVIFLVLIAAIGGGAYYFFVNSNYISTNDAMIQGDIVTLPSPMTGNLTSWSVQEGDTYTTDQTVGSVGAADAKTLTPPIQGTAIQASVVKGENVTQGEALAKFVNLSKLYIVANIDENVIQDVQVGKDVDITLDAFPGTTYKGTVQLVGFTTSSAFSLLPAGGASGTYTKVAQRIPVKISLTNYPKGVVPGMNASVTIHR
ncbi:MAG: secretion protein HlyD family protein [Bacilli bacterium]|nr:secretion protein HlyD family protein [Bacilli bacterium]